MATVVEKSGNGPLGSQKEPHIGDRPAPFFQLLTNMNSGGPGPGVANIPGGDYVWSVDATNWNGATATLQALGLDGITWYPVLKSDGVTPVTATARTSIGIGVGQKTVLRVNITGAIPTGMSSTIAGLL